MKNITLSADERLIEAARARARREHTTLNEQFRRWLAGFAYPDNAQGQALAVLEELRDRVRSSGRRISRDEMNER